MSEHRNERTSAHPDHSVRRLIDAARPKHGSGERLHRRSGRLLDLIGFRRSDVAVPERVMCAASAGDMGALGCHL